MVLLRGLSSLFSFTNKNCSKDVVGANVLITNCTHYPINIYMVRLIIDALFFFFFWERIFYNNNNNKII